MLINLQWYSSGTTFSEYAKGGHYKMTKADKRENIIMVFFSTPTAFFFFLFSDVVHRLPVNR